MCIPIIRRTKLDRSTCRTSSLLCCSNVAGGVGGGGGGGGVGLGIQQVQTLVLVIQGSAHRARTTTILGTLRKRI